MNDPIFPAKMSVLDNIIDPRFLAASGTPNSVFAIGDAFFPHRATGQSLAVNVNSNDENAPLYVDMPDVTNEPCAIGPASRSGAPGAFNEYPDGREFVLFKRYIPGFRVGLQLVVTRVSGTVSTHKLEAVEHEGNDKMTRLTVTKLA